MFSSILLEPLSTMFGFLNFDFFMKFVYALAKCSGYVFVFIDPLSRTITITQWSFIYTFCSLAFSFFTMTYQNHLSIIELTSSTLLDLGVRVMGKALIWGPSMMKFLYIFDSRAFATILMRLQRCHQKVCRFFLFMTCH